MISSDQLGGADDYQDYGGESDECPVPVCGRADIPKPAPPGRVYRIEAVVQSVTERATKNGNSCYFLKVRDTLGVLFFVVVWDWQWAKMRETVRAGTPAVLDVRPPVPGVPAFTLA